jgi:plastocyanin
MNMKRLAAAGAALALALAPACSKDDNPSSSGGDGGTRELNSGSIAPGGMYSHTFADAGDYPYHCAFHPVMTGAVTVEAGSPNTDASVSIVSSSSTGFQPSDVTIAPGGTVTWTNNHSVAHTVTSD